jgi:hypothetical protein
VIHTYLSSVYRRVHSTTTSSYRISSTSPMSVVHPDDLSFTTGDPVSVEQISALFLARLGLTVNTSHITSPTSTQGAYNKVYFVSLPSSGDQAEAAWAGKDVVLRIARSALIPSRARPYMKSNVQKCLSSRKGRE